MFGMKENSNRPFQFDLEKELRRDKHKLKQLKNQIDEKVNQIKAVLRQGVTGDSLDQYGEMLQGYVALQKVLIRME